MRVAVAVSSPVFGMMRSGSIRVGLVAREMIKGRLKASPHAAITTSRIRLLLDFFSPNQMLLSLMIINKSLSNWLPPCLDGAGC